MDAAVVFVWVGFVSFVLVGVWIIRKCVGVCERAVLARAEYTEISGGVVGG